MKTSYPSCKPEILAPAGTYESLKAAVSAGADAVYLGGDRFGARAFAGNFSTEELLSAIDYCHLFDVKVYLTANTLFKENEIGFLASYIRPFYEGGLDAVLVQDMGAVEVLKEEFPDLPLHASTQMSISSVYGAALLKKTGFTRIVPARELSLKEISEIRNAVDMEIETFVHGAMCFAYSGKCLFSSFLGGRSGNRGRCAQPCRQSYVPEGGAKGEGSYLMSLKDMCTLRMLPELIDEGIDSFKIEGRMKKPEYVAAVTDAYVSVRDHYLREKAAAGKGFKDWDRKKQEEFYAFTEAPEKALKDIYNRGGFCTGYYQTEKGPAMFAKERPNHDGLPVGTVEKTAGPEVFIKLKEELYEQDVIEIREAQVEFTGSRAGKAGETIPLKAKGLKKIRPGMTVYRTRNNHLLEEIRERFLEKENRLPAEAVVTAVKGSPLSIEIRKGEVSVSVSGSIVEQAASKPVTEAQLLEKIGKTGGSNLLLSAECRMEEDVFVSMSEFNTLRREAMEQFKAAKAALWRRTNR